MIAAPLVPSPCPAGNVGSGGGCRWLRSAIETAALASGNWPLTPDPAPWQWTCFPKVAIRTPGTDTTAVPAARDFASATVQRWGAAERSGDVAVVVSELLANALRHALPGPGPARPHRVIQLGLARLDHACCARSPTPAGNLRCSNILVPWTKLAAGCTSSALSATTGATPRSATREKPCGPSSPQRPGQLARAPASHAEPLPPGEEHDPLAAVLSPPLRVTRTCWNDRAGSRAASPLPGADQAPARPRRPHQRIRAGRVEAQVKAGGRVLEPHRCATRETRTGNSLAIHRCGPAARPAR